MKQPYPSGIQSLLTQPALHKLVNQTAKLQHLQTILEGSLDTTLGAHCKVANFSTGVLTLVIDSSAFATQLRYAQHSLLENLKKYNEFNEIYKIDWLISPSGAPVPPPPSVRTLSKENAQLLIDAAHACGSEELKNVLLRLANHSN